MSELELEKQDFDIKHENIVSRYILDLRKFDIKFTVKFLKYFQNGYLAPPPKLSVCSAVMCSTSRI